MSADDHGGTAGSLNPLDRRKSSDADKPKEPGKEGDGTPGLWDMIKEDLHEKWEEEKREGKTERARRSRRDEDDEEDRPRRRRRRYEDDEEDIRRKPQHKLWNNRVTGGLVSIVIGIVLFGVGLALDRTCFWPIIVLVIGVISLITGLITGRDE